MKIILIEPNLCQHSVGFISTQIFVVIHRDQMNKYMDCKS